jgi:hypothetical protein
MSSIRSTLIRSCFSNIQRELNQLEDWLNRDFTDVPEVSPSAHSSTDSNIIYQAIQQLSKQLDSQQHTLHHIIDRIDVLEETRNIHIQDKDATNLWLDTEGVQLQNEIVDNEYEPIINVNKTDEAPVIMEPVVVEPIVEPVLAAPVVEEPVLAAPVVVEPVVVEEPVIVEPVLAAPVVEEPAAEVPPVEEPAAEEPVAEEPAVEEPATEEEAEEEEDGLEEVEYNGTTYYRDSDMVMYLLQDDGELSDPVGVWREKTQAIKFYKK